MRKAVHHKNHGPLKVVAGPDLTTQQLHDLLQLRCAIFVVEQNDAYQPIDGDDLQPTTQHLWLERAGSITAAVRLVEWQGQWRIGAVITSAEARGQGQAGALLRKAIELASIQAPRRDIVLHAQAHLAPWYARFGFVVEGDEHLDGTIPHLWMRLRRGSGSPRRPA